MAEFTHLAFAYGILAAGWGLRRSQAGGPGGGAGAEVGRNDGPREYLRGGALFQCGEGRRASSRSWGANSTSARPRTIAPIRPSTPTTRTRRGPGLLRIQPPAGAGGERRGLSQPDPDYFGGVAAWVLSQAAGEQEVSGGKCEGADRVFRLPERGAVRRADGGALREGQGRGASSTRTSSGKGISISRFRTRGWSRRRRFTRTCSGWRRNWRFRWC